MEKLSKFLGTDGLTQTSANHIANIAKEMYEALETKMESIRLFNRDYTLAINGKTYRVENESAKEELIKGVKKANYMDEDALDVLYGCASHHGYSQYYLPSMR